MCRPSPYLNELLGRSIKLLMTRVQQSALLRLSRNRLHIQPHGGQVEHVVKKKGWSRASLGIMRKINSFLKESQCLIGSGAVNMRRMATKDFTFSDGTFMPKAITVVVPSRCLHLDNEHYDNTHVFDLVRFSNMCCEGGEGTKHQFDSTGMENTPALHCDPFLHPTLLDALVAIEDASGSEATQT
ncbi:hypothetical protein HD554DRAFT_923472 [Boletus coccyginus]|nr:hypothetical protein HD554DRAFT_923472 [Boletus coccyginus]